MYICKSCGNKKYFKEHNYIETNVNLDEDTGEYISGDDKFLSCCEVVCGVCGASSEDAEILDRNTNEPIILDN